QMSAGSTDDATEPDHRQTLLEEMMTEIELHSLELNDIWNVISMGWWRTVVAAEGDVVQVITPIDNSDITITAADGNYSLAPNLVEKRDFVTIPGSSFEVLVSYFGIGNEQRDRIERVVIEDKRHGNILEIYPEEFEVVLARDRTKKISLYLRNDTVGTLRAKVVKAFCLSEQPSRVRLFIEHRDKLEPRLEWLRDVNDDDYVCAVFSTTRTIVVDELDDEGRGCIQKWHSTDCFDHAEVSSATPASQHPKGVCGLVNLGHTCFMNAGLQCMLNVPEIAGYFISDRFLSDINEANPLGTGGRLARAYAGLVKATWSGKHEFIIPRNFKRAIGKFAPLFSGFHRQDAQELVAALLDGLHEDLNRIKQKPYIDEADPPEGMAQKEIADESWSNYRKRNDSVIVDSLHGQLRGTLVCPQCGKVSIKFDPFCF
ncbi:hypothetical protein PENTCL1PPCAC_21451, partial [Pristionchus entomophagus]